MGNLVGLNEKQYISETVPKIYDELINIINLINNTSEIYVGKVDELVFYEGITIRNDRGFANLYKYEIFYKLVNFARMLGDTIDNIDNLNLSSEIYYFHLKDFFFGIVETVIFMIDLELINKGYFHIFEGIYFNHESIPMDYKPNYYELEFFCK
jgi:hypothetical protein